MNQPKKASLVIITLAFLVLLGILGRSFLFENFILPLMVLCSFIYQVLSSIDQIVYWLLFTFSILLYASYRWLMQLPLAEANKPEKSNAILQRIDYWKISLHLTQDEINLPNGFKRDLVSMLVTIYALRKSNHNQQQIHQALKQGQIPLPPRIYAFLFPDLSTSFRLSYNQTYPKKHGVFKNLIDRVTGKTVQEYYQSIEEVLNYMNSLMEIKP